MGFFGRFEHGLERTWNGFFARAFKSEVQPVEISAAIRRAMDDRAQLLAPGRTIVPNLYAIELSPTDYGRLAEYEQAISQELIAAAAEHADHERYAPAGDFVVRFSPGQDLETGVFRVRPGSSTRGQQDQGQGQGPAYASGAHAGGGYGPQGQGPGYTGPGQQGQYGQQPSQHGQYGQYGQQPSQQGQQDQYSSPGGYAQQGHGPAYAAAGPQHAGPAAPNGQPRPHAQQAHQSPHGQQGPAPQRQGNRPAGGAPRLNPAARPWLEMNGDRYPLINALTTLGRDHDADIVLDDPGISRHHSELRVTNDGPHLVTSIRDLGSTNGTFVNGDRVSSEHLSDGDRITVGRITLTFHAGRR